MSGADVSGATCEARDLGYGAGVNGGEKPWRLAGEKCSACLSELLAGAWLAAHCEGSIH